MPMWIANDHHIVDRDVKTDAPGSSGGESLADLVLKSGANTLGRNLSPLASANPMVSGMAGFDEVVDISYCLFVETEDKDSQKAKNIIKSMGEGWIPNISRNKSVSREESNP